MTPAKTIQYRDTSFRIQEGTTHPAYSIACFETDEADFKEKYWQPQPGQVVVDVGASYGAYSIPSLAVGARVIAFEPEPSVVKDLRANVDLNRFTNCYVSEHALWDCDETLDFQKLAPHWPAQTITALFKATTLDSYKLDRVDMLKIDIEGAEARALRGATDTLKRCRPYVVIEVHVFMEPTLMDQCRSVLYECGYSDFEVISRPPCEFLIARAK